MMSSPSTSREQDSREDKINSLSNILITFCKANELKISQSLALLTVKIVILSPTWSGVVLRDMSETQMQNFLEECFNYLANENLLSSITIKMQFLFYKYYLNRDQYKDRKKQTTVKSYSRLLGKLKKMWHNPTEDFRAMYDDLIRFILIKEEMDDERDHLAFDEIKTALNSIFPPSGLSSFVLSKLETKMKYLNEIAPVAAGIRLHAWYKKKAGEYMFDVGKIMKETLPKILEELHEEYNDIKEKVEELQKILQLEVLEGKSKTCYESFHQKSLLIGLTNYCEFVKTLMEDVDAISVQTYKLDYTFTIQINELSRNLFTGIHAKAEKTFPWYKDIAKTWKETQMEGHLLHFYIDLFQEIRVLGEQAQTVREDTIVEILEIEDTSSEKSGDMNPIIIHPEEVKNFSEITLQYRGYCPWFGSMGIILPAKRELGLVSFKNACYGFSSMEAKDKFLEDPQKCINSIKSAMRTFPELIITFQMEEEFDLPVINTLKRCKISPVFVSDCSTQTVLHPIEKNIDYSYEWNVWSLRRQAIKYVNVLGKQTHSTQTNDSLFRRDNCSQVYLPRDNSAQTKRDASTSMPTIGDP